MSGTLSKIFNKQTNHDFKPGTSPSDPGSWPSEWKTVVYKSYPRFLRIPLPQPGPLHEPLGSALLKRKSERNFGAGKAVTLEELSTLLYGAALRPAPEEEKRLYPSGGERYPLELYIAARNVEGLAQGIYHYHVPTHSLEALTLDPEYLSALQKVILYPWAREVPLGIIVTAAWERNFAKYGDRGYRMVLLEAGHLMQNINLIAAAIGMKSCDLCGFNNAEVDGILCLEHEDENSIYMGVFGK